MKRKVAVYHAAFGEGGILVAEVETEQNDECDALEAAYTRTQNIDSAWIEGEGITLHGQSERGCRSTSVGDYMMIASDVFRVEGCGFKKMAAGFVVAGQGRHS